MSRSVDETAPAVVEAARSVDAIICDGAAAILGVTEGDLDALLREVLAADARPVLQALWAERLALSKRCAASATQADFLGRALALS